MIRSQRPPFVQPVEMLPDGRVAKVSSGYGPRGTGTHEAVDMMVPWQPGDPVGHPDTDNTKRWTMPVGVNALSITDGVVTHVFYAGAGLGWGVLISHPAKQWGYDSIQSGYRHLDRPLVSVGQKVRAGQPIGVIGIGGGVRHLHFTLVVNGRTIDPKPWIEKWPIIRPASSLSVGTVVFLAFSAAALAGAIGYTISVRSR